MDTSEDGLDSIQYEIGSGELDFALESDMFEVQTWPIKHDLCGPLWSTSTFKSNKLDSLSWPVSYQIKDKRPTWTIDFDDDDSDEDAYLAGIEAGKSYPYTLRVQLAFYPLQAFIELEDRILFLDPKCSENPILDWPDEVPQQKTEYIDGDYDGTT